jgi:hypothetical protein
MKSIYTFMLLCVFCLSATSQSKIQNKAKLNIKSEAFAKKKENNRESMKAMKQLATVNKSSAVCLYDSIHVANWDKSQNKWQHSEGFVFKYDKHFNITSYTNTESYYGATIKTRVINTYDGNNNQISELYQVYKNTSWYNEYKITWTFDANNNELSATEQEWGGWYWTNLYKITNTFDANNNLTSELYQSGNGLTWNDRRKTMYTYVDNNLITEVHQEWKKTYWQNIEKKANNYHNNNLSEIIIQYWQNNAWQDDSKTMFAYDANNNLVGEIYQYWDGSAWNIQSINSFEYNNQNYLTSSTRQYWDGTSFVNSNKYTYTYDSNGNQTVVLLQEWYDSDWKNWYRRTYNYNTNNVQISLKQEHWYGSYWEDDVIGVFDLCDNNYCSLQDLYQISSNGSLQNNFKYDYFGCTTITGIAGETEKLSDLSLFPNPNAGTFTVRIPNTKHEVSLIEVYNTLGQQVFIQQFDNEKAEIDLSGHAEGVYSVRVSSNGKSNTIKVLVKK